MEKLPTYSYDLIDKLDKMYNKDILSINYNFHKKEEYLEEIYKRIGQRELIESLINLQINEEEEKYE